MISNKGPWVALYTKTINSATVESLTCAERSVFLQCLLLAARVEYDYPYNKHFYHLMPGQFVVSQRDLAAQCGEGCTRKIVRSTIDKLVADHTWAQSKAQAGAQSPNLITFINWSVYQHQLKPRAQSRAQSRAKLGPTDTLSHSINGCQNDAVHGSNTEDTKRVKNSPLPQTEWLDEKDLDAVDYQAVADAWASICVPAGMHGIRDLTPWHDKIRTAWVRIQASKDEAWTHMDTMERLRDLFGHAARTPFLCGHSARKWKADLEFVLRPLSVDRIMSGFYDTAVDYSPGITVSKKVAAHMGVSPAEAFTGEQDVIKSGDDAPRKGVDW